MQKGGETSSKTNYTELSSRPSSAIHVTGSTRSTEDNFGNFKIDYKELKIGAKLGEGAFGEVFK